MQKGLMQEFESLHSDEHWWPISEKKKYSSETINYLIF